MIYTLENDNLTVKVSTLGAELQGIYSKSTDKEYIWQPGAETWNTHSILLFPNPGRIAHDRTIIGGRVYPATMHGFAKDMEFAVAEQSGEKLVLELVSNDATRFFLPYEYCFRVSFTLKGDMLYQKLEVENRDNKKIYFSLGAHPGFYCPIELGESGDDYVLRFNKPQNMNKLIAEDATKLLTRDKIPFLKNETDIPLSETFFNDLPRLYGDVDADTITMLSTKSGRFVEMGIKGFPFMCLWGAPSKMSIVSIEPWCGMSDYTDTDHVWETKIGIEFADVGQTFERTLTFRVG